VAAESIFTAGADKGVFVPTEHAGGPWDPNALHGGAAAALIVSELEQLQSELQLRFGKLSFELLRPVPSAPLSLSIELIRAGRRVQEVAAELRHRDEPVCRAKALKLQPVQEGVLEHVATDLMKHPPAPPLPPPDSPNIQTLSGEGPLRASFASAVEMRWLTQPWTTGPAKMWMRLHKPVLPGRPISPLASLAAASDFGNGVAAELRFDRFLFINADLTVHLWREPRSTWIGLDARTLLEAGGTGVAVNTLHDLEGPIGSAYQTLVVQGR
jgi:hypothetical protein